MATIVLQVPDENLVTKVKQACKMLMGVTSVKVQKSKNRIYDPETGEQILAYKKRWLLKPGSSFYEKIDFPEMLKIIQRFPKVG